MVHGEQSAVAFHVLLQVMCISCSHAQLTVAAGRFECTLGTPCTVTCLFPICVRPVVTHLAVLPIPALLELSSVVLPLFTVQFLWTPAEILVWRAQDGKGGCPPSSFLIGGLAGCCARPLATVVAGATVLAPVCVVWAWRLEVSDTANVAS